MHVELRCGKSNFISSTVVILYNLCLWLNKFFTVILTPPRNIAYMCSIQQCKACILMQMIDKKMGKRSHRRRVSAIRSVLPLARDSPRFAPKTPASAWHGGNENMNHYLLSTFNRLTSSFRSSLHKTLTVKLAIKTSKRACRMILFLHTLACFAYSWHLNFSLNFNFFEGTID